MTYPPAVIDRLKKLIEIVEANPINIPLKNVADFLGKDINWLRGVMEQGNCPYGFGGAAEYEGKRSFCIPTLQFWILCTGGKIDYLTLTESLERSVTQ